MAHNANNSESPVEKLALFLEGDDFDETTASTAELAEQVRRIGIDPEALTDEIERMVALKLAEVHAQEVAAETYDREFWLRRAKKKSAAARKGFDQKEVEEPDYIPLAAQMSETQSEDDESDNDLSFVAAVSIQEAHFEILRDGEAYVYLAGPVPEGVTHLCLASVCYEIAIVPATRDLFRIQGIGLVGIQRYLAQQSPAAEDRPIGLARVQMVAPLC